MSGRENDKERIIRIADEREEFVPLEDGYVYWGSTGTSGALSAWMLRALADELDRRNKEWDTIIQNDPRIG